jgi:hypothetical protein
MMRYIYICDVILYWFSTFESLIGQLLGFRIQYRLRCIIFYLESTTSYISVLSPYLFANVFIWCCCCFTCLKFWKNEYILYFLMFVTVCRFFHRYFWGDVFWTLVNFFPMSMLSTLVNTHQFFCAFSELYIYLLSISIICILNQWINICFL